MKGEGDRENSGLVMPKSLGIDSIHHLCFGNLVSKKFIYIF